MALARRRGDCLSCAVMARLQLRRVLASLLVSSMVSAGAYGGTTAPVQSGAQIQPSTVSPSSWLGSIALGTPRDPTRGDTVRQPRFRHGEMIQLELDASGAPADAQITVTWRDAKGNKVGQETQATRQGERVLTFNAPGYGAALRPGTYRVQVEVDGRMVHDQRFEIAAS